MPSRRAARRAESAEGEATIGNWPETNAVKAAEELVAKHKKILENNRKAMEVDHGERVAALKRKIDRHFESRKARVMKFQGEIWDRLEALNKKRQIIEFRILRSTRAVETATLNLRSEMTAMFEGRIEEILSHPSSPVARLSNNTDK